MAAQSQRVTNLGSRLVLSPFIVLKYGRHEIEDAPSQAAVFRVDITRKEINATHLQEITAKVDVVAPILKGKITKDR